tara:strand:+ start:1286 stop:2083 length:798 start_codon:yes stop_codon:yes gene_type:complete
MVTNIWIHILALVCLFPAVAAGFKGGSERGTFVWAGFGLAAAVATAWSAVQMGPGWNAGFGAALWLTVAATFVIFLVLSLVMTDIWRLGPLLAPYLVLLAIVAVIWSQVSAQSVSDAPSGWFGIHVALSIGTYVFLTLAAVAGAAVILQERALKRRAPDRLTRSLPSLADSETLEYRLLGAGEVILAAGIVTGMGAQYATDGGLIELSHKTILTLAAFGVIAALLVARQAWGTRGRKAARYVLIGYLLMTLAYPGVKFVTDVLIG